MPSPLPSFRPHPLSSLRFPSLFLLSLLPSPTTDTNLFLAFPLPLSPSRRLLIIPSVALAWISSTFPRPRAKRAMAYAVINSLGNVAQIWSPYRRLFPASSFACALVLTLFLPDRSVPQVSGSQGTFSTSSSPVRLLTYVYSLSTRWRSPPIHP